MLEGEVFYIYVKTENNDEKPVPLFTDEDKERYADKIQSIKVYFRKPNYKIFNAIMKEAIITSLDGTMMTHPKPGP